MREKDELIKMIKENETVIRYQRLEKSLNEHEPLKKRLNDLKTLQKQLVRESALQKNTISLQKAYDEALNALLEIPLVEEYFALQSDINDMLQQIVHLFENGLNKT